MLKICILILAQFLIAICADAASIDNLRFSVLPARVRLVLDSKDIIKYTVTKNDKQIIVDLTNSSSIKRNPKIVDDLIKDVSLVPINKKTSRLIINLAKNNQYQIFALSNPHRLVLDFPKIEKIDKTQKIQNGINYRFIQNELEGRQFQAYIVTATPEARMELRPFSAAGAYNGRGSLVKRSSELGLIAAVNASYFDQDGWVVGVTKDKGKLISVEETPHSAFVSYLGIPKILKDIVYSAYIELKDGTRIPIKGMNRMRITDDCVLYNDAFAPTTKTNQWGLEIKLKNDRVISVSKLGNMPIEPGNIVISAHGTMAQALAKVRPGERLKIVQSLWNYDADQAETVVGAGPLLVENGLVNVRAKEENIAKDIAEGRAPRTAIGITKDRSIMLVVVDGRSSSSCGMTLKELAGFMVKLGCDSALNLDGGGSSEMVIKNRIVNHPSDGVERRVSIGVGFFPR